MLNYRLQYLGLVFVSFFTFAIFPVLAVGQTATQNFSLPAWTVGQSVTYETQTFKNGKLAIAEKNNYSVVGKEKIKGQDFYWLEIEHQDSYGPSIILKLQVQEPRCVGFEDYLEKGLALLTPRRKIQKLIFEKNKNFNTANEFEVPEETIARAEEVITPSLVQKTSSHYALTPAQLLRVKAGQFETVLFHQTTLAAKTSVGGEKSGPRFFDAWGSPKAPIWGEVKSVSQDVDSAGETVLRQTELTSFSATGAVSRIKETPRMIPASQKRRTLEDLSASMPTFSTIQGH